MQRKPRKTSDRLVNHRLIALAYGQIGLMQTGAGFIAYFGILGEYGFYLTDLYQIRYEWDNKNVNDLKDYYGQEWVSTFVNNNKTITLIKSFTKQNRVIQIGNN